VNRCRLAEFAFAADHLRGQGPVGLTRGAPTATGQRRLAKSAERLARSAMSEIGRTVLGDCYTAPESVMLAGRVSLTQVVSQ
jgi:hypothetical protein